jgi:hypothetical protein
MDECTNYNTTGEALKIEGFKVEGTGGNCSALIKRVQLGSGCEYEVLLTDGDLYHPDSLPCEFSAYFYDLRDNQRILGGQVVGSEKELVKAVSDGLRDAYLLQRAANGNL